MKILKVGDTKKVACDCCESFQTATFKLRDVPFSDNSGIVKNVLVGVCDHCDSVTVLPHQSTPAVRKQLEVQRQPIESRVPAHIIDILNLSSDSLGAGVDFNQSIMKYYIHSLSTKAISALDIPSFLDSDLAKGASQKRISIKGRYIKDEFSLIKEMTKIDTTTALLKCIVLKIHDDLLVNKDKKAIKDLQGIMAATI